MWKAIHITYNDDQDNLLLDGVQPVIRLMQVKGYIQRVYVFRQCLPAPTIVMHIEVEREKDYKKALRLCKSELSPYMSRYSSTNQSKATDDEKISKLWMQDKPSVRVDNCEHHSIHEGKLTLPHGLHEQEHITELLHSFYAYTYGLIIRELEQCRGQIQTKYYRVVRMMAANGEYDLYQSLITGYMTPRARVESYMQRLREREFVSKQYEDTDNYYGLIIDHALADLLHNTNERGVYEGSDELLRMWSTARQQLCAAITALDKAGLFHKDKLYAGVTNLEQLIGYIMYYSMKLLLPLFELDVKQQYMMEYLIIRSMERIESTEQRQLQVSSHR